MQLKRVIGLKQHCFECNTSTEIQFTRKQFIMYSPLREKAKFMLGYELAAQS